MPYAYRVMIDFAQANNRRTRGQNICWGFLSSVKFLVYGKPTLCKSEEGYRKGTHGGLGCLSQTFGYKNPIYQE